MQPHKHSHLYRQRDIHTVIARFGNKPSEKVRQNIHESLSQYREEFIEKQAGPPRSPSRGRGDGGRGR
jgi:hypothetical protein